MRGWCSKTSSTLSSVLGPRVAALVLALIALGAVVLVVSIGAGHARVALGVLASAWLYCAGIAAGGIALSSAIRLAHGRWAVAVTPIAEACAGFFAPALVLLAVLVLGAAWWIPGAATEDRVHFLARVLRELLATAALFSVGALYVKRARAASAFASEADVNANVESDRDSATRLAIVYLLLYAATLSLWACDFVLTRADQAPSTVIPPFVFVGAFVGGLAFCALVATLLPAARVGSATRHDLGKLLFASIILWAYLVWAAYLPVWYENLPDETGFLLARWTHGWKPVTMLSLASVLLFPFFLFLPEQSKRGRATLALGAASILAGLYAERVLLVLPSLPDLQSPLGIPIGAAITAAVMSLFLSGFLGEWLGPAAGVRGT